jgi:threonine aldolase
MSESKSASPFNSIDLRSDTVTQPSPEMRKAIARAPVGDDQFGEDPTINLLQEKVASILGKESSLWFPSGTMTNQVALKTLTNHGDDVIVSRESHAVWHEKGAGAVNSGIQFTEIGEKGIFSLEEFLSAIKSQNHLLYPPTTLVEIENTHNRCGGIIFPQSEIEKICAAAKENNIKSYLDGARLWNAAVASNKTPAEIAAPFDLVGVALSKGLGAPGGSLIAGSKKLIEKATRYRRMFGGAMRQVGIFAAAGLYALEHNMEKLHEDHSNAKIIANKLGESKRVIIDPSLVQTNIIVFNLSDDAPEASVVVEKAKENGVLIFAFGKKTIRAVTHLDVSRKECEQAAKILFDIIEDNN